MDFGTDSNAKEMYAYQKENHSTGALAISGYSDTVAIAQWILGGIIVFAHFKQFYFELKFIRFSEQNQATDAAIQFLNFFKGKIE